MAQSSHTIRFKKWPYGLYAPWLYRGIKLWAAFDLYRWQIPQQNLSALAGFYWNRFLAKQFAAEMRYKGAQIYQGERLLRTTDTVYVLGCGASINDVTKLQWKEIGQHYSIGVNAFYVHDFTANAYFTEFSDNPFFQKLISERLFEDPKRVDAQKFISAYYAVVESSGYRTPKLSNPIFYSPDRIRIRDPKLLERITKVYFSNHTNEGRLLHQVSNLDVVINYCVTQGFKRIVLVGVDLNNDGYFWDSGDDATSNLAKQFMNSFRAAKGEKKGGAHATATQQQGETLGRLNIIEYIQFLNRQILASMDVIISVANPNSLLAEHVEVTEIPKFSKSKS